MRHVRSLAALLCALPVLLGTAPRPFPVRDAGLFIGRVVDYDTGAPLAGVPVAVGTVLVTGDRLPARVPPGVEATATGADVRRDLSGGWSPLAPHARTPGSDGADVPRLTTDARRTRMASTTQRRSDRKRRPGRSDHRRVRRRDRPLSRSFDGAQRRLQTRRRVLLL